MTKIIKFTDNALKQIERIISGKDKRNYFRITVKGGGCSGFTYTVDFDNQKGKFDLEFESFGLNVLVDKKSHLFIKGTEIDWSDDLNDRGLKFNNPSAKGSCGCRTSFMHEGVNGEETPNWM